MKKDNKGFSLVELIIVIAIMAVLIGILAPQYLKFVRKSRISTDITNAEEIATAINVAVSDGELTLPAAGGTTNLTNAQIAAISNMPTLQGSKVDTTIDGTKWTAVLDEHGVASVSLDGTVIWPTPAAGSDWVE